MTLALIDAAHHRVRHVRPTAGAEPGMVPSSEQLLGRNYSFRDLPISSIPETSDFSEASWTARLNDAGMLSISFPNRGASDGVPWRNRFSTYGHTEFLEVYRDDVLEQVAVILTAAPSQQAVIVTGQDGWFLLRDAYERDCQLVLAPRDVIERYSSVWTPILVDDFVELDAERWVGHAETSGTGEATGVIQATGGFKITASSGATGANAGRYYLESKDEYEVIQGGRWTYVVNFTLDEADTVKQVNVLTFNILNPKAINFNEGFSLEIYVNANSEVLQKPTAPSVVGAGCALFGNKALESNGEQGFINLPQGFSPGPHSVLIECDGRFVRAFVDGYLIGYAPVRIPTVEKGMMFIACGGPEEGTMGITLHEVIFRQASPFLMRGAERGDYVLPGGVETYPYGGLTGRYYNDADLAEYKEYFHKCFAPNRTGTGPGGSYKDRTDATIDNPEPPYPGAASEYWSCRWFGAVYLDLETNPEVEFIVSNLDDGCRLWVGETQLGTQIIDEWTGGSARERTGKVKASYLGAVKGWFPIILEYFQGAAAHGVELKFKPVSSGWTDPGGTVLSTGTVIIPSTSLCPLGCVDQHYQGASHFNLTQETAAAFGYQMTCEPMQLESGLFPGQLVPQARVGRDTDERLEKDDILSNSPIVNYKSTVDATDQISSLRAIGSGLPDGQNGQIQVEECDIATMQASLFDLQGWLDASDTNSPSLLGVRCASQLELQTEPWQNIEGEPLARDRLADTFPLTGDLAAMRWRPGDGVRIWLPDIGVEDLTPRQLMQVTRQFGPIGRHATQMGFRQRPIDRVSQINRLIRRAGIAQRNYQRQIVTLPVKYLSGAAVVLAAGESTHASVPLLPSDVIISAKLVVVTNETAQALTVENLSTTTFQAVPALTEIRGTAPAVFDIKSALVCRSDPGISSGSAYILVKNAGTSTTLLDFHLVISVLR